MWLHEKCAKAYTAAQEYGAWLATAGYLEASCTRRRCLHLLPTRGGLEVTPRR